MLTIPIYDTILLPEVTFYFKKEVIDSWQTTNLVVGEHLVFALLSKLKAHTLVYVIIGTATAIAAPFVYGCVRYGSSISPRGSFRA